MVDSRAEEMTNGASVLIVSATGDGPPRWSPPPASSPRRLTLELGGKRHRGFWAVQFDTAVHDAVGPLVLMAEGFASLAIVRWAQLSPRRYLENIVGALLFSPLSLELEQGPLLRDMYPSPALPLPFPSAVIETSGSPLIMRARDLADTWKSALIDADDMPDDWRVSSDVRPAQAPVGDRTPGERTAIAAIAW